MTHVIHFADLEHMISLLDPGEYVWIAEMKTVEGQDKTGVMYEVIGVHVRQIQANGQIYSWMFPAARFRTSRGTPLEKEDEVAMTGGFEYARHISQLIANQLLNKDTYKLRNGIVDLDGKLPLAGYWSLLDDQEPEEEVESQDQPEPE